MTPSQECKALGFNLAHVSKVTGVSPQTLTNWQKNKPDLFRVVLAGIQAQAVLKEIKAWDVDNYLMLPVAIRKRIQANLDVVGG